MADELDKKPKPIGTPAPNYPKPKQESAPAPAPAPKIDRQKSASFGNVKVKPGSPNMPESVPVGVQQTKFESPKHVDKRVNKMFKDTNQPTLGVWNKNNTNPMADPDKVKFNPKLDYKPSKEALEAANRKKIMQQGFAPKDWDGKSDVEEPKPAPAPAQKPQGYDYDRLSKELDSGNMTNLDGGLLPYEYGFDTNGHEDLAVDARKNPETGKYEVFMYPETENGPVEEPDENYPDYEFDSFDDLKAFMENNYKKVEKPKYDPMNEPGSGGVTKELVDFVREQLKADGGLNDNFIDAYLSKMPQNSNQADYWKGKYQEAWNKKYGGNK